ncbi:MAG: hypothetical protein M3O50_09220 [Myxococcota bacterium]|nr:hypothetical protein [Myxococcota bacterium]
MRRNGFWRGVAAALPVAFLAAWSASASAQSEDEESSVVPLEARSGLSGTLSNALLLRDEGGPETTLMTIFTASFAWTDAFSTFVRVGSVVNSSPGLRDATELSNGAAGLALELHVTKHLTLGGQSGATIPFGTGGGDAASPGEVRAWVNCIDWDTMFAMNHVDVFNGLRMAYELSPFTLSVESVLHELLRVRGANNDPVGSGATITGTSASLSYAVLPALSLSTGLSETRVWNAPDFVRLDANSRADYFLSGAVSTTLKLHNAELRPALIYARALDPPLSTMGFQVIQLDFAFSL